VVAAKTELAHKHLSDQFADHGRTGALHRAYIAYCWGCTETGKGTVEKRYHALVQGPPDPSSGTIDAPIGRHRGHDWKFAVTEDGRHSITHYDTLEAHQAASLLDIELETGRTHQIRVHFAALHHPCCGDLTYGSDPKLAKKLGLERQWLHARSLAFAHPADGRRVEITSPYPADLQHALDVLRRHEL